MERHLLSRREFLRNVALWTAGTVLAACGGTPSPAPVGEIPLSTAATTPVPELSPVSAVEQLTQAEGLPFWFAPDAENLKEIVRASYTGVIPQICGDETKIIKVGWWSKPPKPFLFGETVIAEKTNIYITREETIKPWLLSTKDQWPQSWLELDDEGLKKLIRLIQENAVKHELLHRCVGGVTFESFSEADIEQWRAMGVNFSELPQPFVLSRRGFSLRLEVKNQTRNFKAIEEAIVDYLTWKDSTEEQREVLEYSGSKYPIHYSILKFIDDDSLVSDLLVVKEQGDFFGLKNQVLYPRLFSKFKKEYQTQFGSSKSPEEINQAAERAANNLANAFLLTAFAPDPNQEFKNYLIKNGLIKKE